MGSFRARRCRKTDGRCGACEEPTMRFPKWRMCGITNKHAAYLSAAITGRLQQLNESSYLTINYNKFCFILTTPMKSDRLIKLRC